MNRRDYDPWTGMLSLREAMNRLLEESVVTTPAARGSLGGMQMPLDLYETPDALVARTSMPGVRPDDIDITVTGDQLTIRGELAEQAPGDEARYHQREHRYGSFARSLTLPVEVQPDKVEATFEHGVLTLTMPKAERMRPKQIKINARSGATSLGAPSGGTAGTIEGEVSDATPLASGTGSEAGTQDAAAAGPSDETAALPAENKRKSSTTRRRTSKNTE